MKTKYTQRGSLNRFNVAGLLSKVAILGLAAGSAQAKTFSIVEDLPTTGVTVTASSTFSAGQGEANLIGTIGLVDFKHDNHGAAGTMWHSALKTPPSKAAEGLDASAEWLKFDFKTPQSFDRLLIWNHNQAGLTNRGLKNVKISTTTDGKTWKTVTALIPKAKGSTSESSSIDLAIKGKGVKSLVIAASSNYGGNVYGLSHVAFISDKKVEEANLPFPSSIVGSPKRIYRHRKDGKPGREVTIDLKGARMHGPSEITLTCEGVTETTKFEASERGLSSLSVLLPANAGVEKDCQVEVVLKAGVKKIAKKFTVPAQRQWTVFMYPHSHVDIGYTADQETIKQISIRNLTVGMEEAERSKDFPGGAKYIWNPEVIWATEHYLAQATKKEKERFVTAVKDGHLGLDASFAHLNTSACSDEELLRIFQGGMKMRKLTGDPVDTFVQMDVPGASWGLMQAAAQAGVRGMIDFPNGFDRVGNIHSLFQRPFWWVAPDGKSKVLYIQGPRYDLGWVWKGQYTRPANYPRFPNPAPGWVQDYPAVVDRLKTDTPSRFFMPLDYLLNETAALEKEGLPYDYFTMTWSMSDNSIVDADLPDAVKAWNEKYAFPKIVIASSSEIIGAYIEKFGDVIPEKSGDLGEYWTDGLGADALRVGYNRLAKERLIQAETIHTMLNPEAKPTSFNKAVYDSWRWILLGSEHTWGYYRPDLAIAKEIEATKSSYFERAKSTSEKIMEDTLKPITKAESQKFTVLNSLSWDRSRLVTVKSKGNKVIDANGKEVPSQRLSTGELAFLASDVPALGSSLYEVVTGTKYANGKATVKGNILDNGLVKVVIDPSTGDISSLVYDNHDYVDGSSQYKLNSFRYLQGGEAPKDASGPSEVKVTVKENGPLVVSLLITSKAEGCNKLTREVRIIDGSPEVLITNVVDKPATRVKEGIHFGFAFNIPDGEIRMDIPWGRMNPVKDLLPGSNRNWLAFQRWVDVSAGDRGVTWTSIESPLIEIGDITANLLGGVHDVNLWRKEIQQTQTIFSWALNNHWHTNFPLQQGGVIPFHYAIIPHGGFDSVAANRFGLNQNRPLIAVPATSNAIAKSMVKVDNPSVFVSTIKRSEDGKANILRLRSISDKEEAIKLNWPMGRPASIQYCLADEAPTGVFKGNDLKVSKHGVVTLRLEDSSSKK